MIVVSTPSAEAERERRGAVCADAVLDAPSEAAFDDLAALAVQVCGTGFALIALVDGEGQIFKGGMGITEEEMPRFAPFCARAVQEKTDLLVVPDALLDGRFVDQALTTGGHTLRFYAAVILRDSNGQAAGTLCVMDRLPRSLTIAQQQGLRALGRLVLDQLELRRATAAMHESAAHYTQVFQRNPIPLFVFDSKTLRYLAVNDATVARYGYSEKEFQGMSLMDLRPPEDRPLLERELAVRAHGLISVGRWRHRKKDGTVLPVHIFAHDTIFAGREARMVLALDVTEQEQALTAYHASEARFRVLSESAPLGIFECDAAGRFTYGNPALLSIFGRKSTEVFGTGWTEAIHAEDRASVLAELHRTLPAGLASDLEFRLLRPDATRRWVHLLASPQQRDEHGRASKFVGTLEDITEKRVSEIAMLESEDRYRKLLLLSPDAHFVHVDNRIALVNQAFCKLLGAADPREIIGRSLFDILHPDEHEPVKQRQRQMLEGQVFAPIEQKFIRLDGSVVEVEASAAAVSIDSKGRSEVQVLARDITARKASQIALRESEERFKLVARAVSDVIWDWNLVTQRVWRSDSYEKIFGLASTDASSPGDLWGARIHSTDRERVIAGLQKALISQQETWVEEYRLMRRDGTHAFVQDRGQIMRDATGKACRMVGGMSDLSERKKLEQQSLRAQRMESIGTLAGGIAHDLNNVLAPILMSIDLLKLSAREDPNQLKLLETIQTSTVRGADLVRQVLTFARGLDGQRVAVNLRHLFRDLERIVGETFPRKIRIVSDARPDVWPILGDPTQIHQVLLNLAVNARDAMLESGVLTLAAANITIDAQFAAASPEAKIGPYVVLSVSDTGMGIPPEIRDRIFEPFFTTKEIGRGTGLGLSTVHAIVKGHGGFETVQSELGVGTTFKIYLPADPSLRPASQKPVSAEPPRGRGELVLVVDDEVSIRQVTQRTLEQFGYRVRIAAEGAEAVSIYSKHTKEISLVLTDMMMPVMDGSATIQVLRRLNPTVKIIAASGLNANENVAKAANLGVSDFLAKPYTAETMLRMFREVLDRAPKAPTS